MNQHSKQRTNLISKIHIAKKQLDMDDDTYRAFLNTAVKKDSCSKMSFSELHQVVAALKKKGFKVTAKKSTSVSGAKMSPASKGRRIDKMRAIWISMAKAGHLNDGSETALLAWAQGEIRRQGGIPVDSLEWLESQDKVLNKVLEQLKRWNVRVRDKARNDDLRTITLATKGFEENKRFLSQPEVIQALLNHSCITWHGLFAEINIPYDESYETNRRALRPLVVALGITQPTVKEIQ